jgi:hypothetical protein
MNFFFLFYFVHVFFYWRTNNNKIKINANTKEVNIILMPLTGRLPVKRGYNAGGGPYGSRSNQSGEKRDRI